MAQSKHGTAIEWTHGEGFKGETWNPAVGCSRVSTGCLHCYAEQVHKLRHDGRNGYPAFLPWTKVNEAHNVTLRPERLTIPLHWRKPRMVFVNSMSDLFHERIPDEYIAAVFAVMAHAEQHIFQVLTKRSERMRALLGDERFWLTVRVLACRGIGDHRFGVPHAVVETPLPNVWVGTSIENRKWVGRAVTLGDTPAAVRFLSCEPLLGGLVADSHTVHADGSESWTWPDGYTGPGLRFYNIDGELAFHWLIVGGESGTGHRPFDPEWARDLRDVCAHEGVAYFLKQTGGYRPGGALEDLPEDLRIREMPAP